MKKLILIVVALLVLGVAGGAAWWRFSHRQDPMELAQTLQAAGDVRGAALQLRAAVRAQPNNATAHLRLGTALLQLGDPTAAEKELRLARSQGATTGDMNVMLAQAYLGQGHNKELLAEFQPPMSTPDLTAQLLMTRALALASLNDPSAALQALQEAEQISPKTASVPLTAARIALSQQNLGYAAAAVERALLIDPKRPDGLLLRAQILRTRGNRAAALTALDDSLSLQPHYVLARLERANLLLELGNDGRARADVDDVLKSQPNSVAAVYLNAVLLARAQDNKTAEAQFQRLSSLLDRFPRGFFFQALVKYNLGQLEQARDFAQRYITRTPNDPDGVKLLAHIDLALKHPDRAIDVLTRASKVGIADSEMFDLLAQAYTAAGQPADAEASANRALALAPQASQRLQSTGSTPLPQNLARLSRPQSNDLTGLTGHTDETKATPTRDTSLAAAAMAAISKGDLDAAEAALAELRAEEGNTEAVGLLNAAILAMRQEYDAAQQQYNKLIATFPSSLRPRVGLAELLLIQGKAEQAEKMLSDILAANPADEASLSAVLPVLLGTGKVDRAIRLLEDATKAAPDNKKIGLSLATLELRVGRSEAALQEVNRVIGKNGQEATAAQLRIRAQSLAALRRTPEAAEVYARLLLKSPGDVDIVREVVTLQVEAKNYLSARDVIQTALQTNVNNIGLYRLLLSVDLAQGGEAMALTELDKLAAAPASAELAPALRGDFDIYRHRYLDAAETFAAIYRTKPTSEGAIQAAGTYLQAGQTKPAADILKAQLDLNPHDAGVLQYLSNLYLSNHAYDMATPLLERFLAEQPDNVVALNNLATVYAEVHNAKAVLYARRAFTIRPSAETGETLAWALIQNGEASAAMTLITQAAQVLPNDPTVQYHYAVALKLTGRNGEALTVAQKIADLPDSFPDQDKVRLLVADLRNGR